VGFICYGFVVVYIFWVVCTNICHKTCSKKILSCKIVNIQSMCIYSYKRRIWKSLYPTVPASWILNKWSKCLWNKSFICSGTWPRRSTRKWTDDSLPLSNTTKHSLCTLYSLTRDIIRFSRYVLWYMLLNITHYFTLYFYMHIYTLIKYRQFYSTWSRWVIYCGRWWHTKPR